LILGKKKFDIPILLDAEDVHNKPDERSIMTYVSTLALKFAFGGNEKEEAIVQNVQSFTWEEINIQGFLQKQDPSGFLKFWRKKWFSLQGFRLLFYKGIPTSSKETPESYISLPFVKSIQENKARTHSFMIVTEDRVHYLQAETKQDMERWMKALSKALDMYKKFAETHSKELYLLQPFGSIEVSDIVKEGYLQEQSSFLKQWSTCYFMLKDGILYRFKNKGDLETERSLPLIGATFEEFEPYRYKFCFKITAAMGSSFILKSESEEDLHLWLNALLKQQLMTEEFIASIKN